jgi:hypothetical protein
MRTSILRVLITLVSALTVVPLTLRAEDSNTSASDTRVDFSGAQPVAAVNYALATAPDQPAAVPASTSASPVSGEWCRCWDDVGGWCDNTVVFLGGEAYKSLGDSAQPPGIATGFMDSAGFAGGFNTGFALFDCLPIRGQIGGSYGVYDLKGRDTVSPSSAEQQSFLSAGVYKRSDILDGDPVSWGLVYDQFWAHQWGLRAGELYVGQVRGIAGYAINERHEIGVWGAFHATEDATATVAGTPLRAMNQYNVYWRYNWDFGGQTMVYVGGNDPADVGSWTLGVLGQAPLSDNTALYGNFTYSFPTSATGVVGSNNLEWNFGVGLVYSWGKKAVSPTVSGRRGLPLLPVANNGSFLISN